MSKLKEDILRLRAEGKSYNQIVAELNCSKGTVAYHCGEGQKKKFLERTRRYREENPLLQKVDRFNSAGKLRHKTSAFGRSDTNKKGYNKELLPTFNYLDVYKLVGGTKTKCYLTGEPIDLLKDQYSLDHIIPVSRGGSNDISNMGVCLMNVNKMKATLTPEELISLCVKILEYNGYILKKPL